MSLEIWSDFVITGLVNDASMLSFGWLVLSVRLFLHLCSYFILLNTLSINKLNKFL